MVHGHATKKCDNDYERNKRPLQEMTRERMRFFTRVDMRNDTDMGFADEQQHIPDLKYSQGLRHLEININMEILMILLLLDKGQNSYEKRNILTRERSVYRYLQKSCGPLEIIPGNIGKRNRRRKEKIVEIFTKTVMENLKTGTVNIHKEETGKSVEALTGRGEKREMNPGTLNETPPE